MGEAQRYQPVMVDIALERLHNLFAYFGLIDDESEAEPVWQRVVGSKEKKWIRSTAGGWIDMDWGRYPIVEEGKSVCTISDHFKREQHVVEAPFTGLVVGMAASPITVPGQIVAHVVSIDEEDRKVIEQIVDEQGYSSIGTYHWMGRRVTPKEEVELAEKELRTPEEPESADSEPERGTA
jgi:hypothetical protein